MGTFQLAILRPLVRAGVKNAHVLLDAFNGRTHTSAAGWVKGYQLPVVSEFCFAGTLAQKEARGAALYFVSYHNRTSPRAELIDHDTPSIRELARAGKGMR